MPPWAQRHINVLKRRADWLEARIHIAADATGKNLDWDKQELATIRFCADLLKVTFGDDASTETARTFETRFSHRGNV